MTTTTPTPAPATCKGWSGAPCLHHCPECNAHDGHHTDRCPTRSDGSACPVHGCTR